MKRLEPVLQQPHPRCHVTAADKWLRQGRSRWVSSIPRQHLTPYFITISGSRCRLLTPRWTSSRVRHTGPYPFHAKRVSTAGAVFLFLFFIGVSLSGVHEPEFVVVCCWFKQFFLFLLMRTLPTYNNTIFWEECQTSKLTWDAQNNKHNFYDVKESERAVQAL